MTLLVSAAAAGPPSVRELRTQKIGDTTYFHVAFAAPPNLAVFQPRDLTFGAPGGRADLGRQPRLVPQDDRARAVYPRWEPLASAPLPFRPVESTGQPPVTGLEFVGQCAGTEPARFLLLYPTEKTLLERQGERDVTVRKSEWVELPIVLDFDKAERVSPPREGRSRARGGGDPMERAGSAVGVGAGRSVRPAGGPGAGVQFLRLRS
jgi:hypothetical protein